MWQVSHLAMHPPQRLFHLSGLIFHKGWGSGGGWGGVGLACYRHTSSLGVTSGIIGKESNPNAGEDLYLWMQTGWRRLQAKAINSSRSVDSPCVETTRMMFAIGEKVSIQLLQLSFGGITFEGMFCVNESMYGLIRHNGENCFPSLPIKPSNIFLVCMFL